VVTKTKTQKENMYQIVIRAIQKMMLGRLSVIVNRVIREDLIRR
jgi:hypothetical protein